MVKPPSIPFGEYQFEYMRSRGPGGQNVNRTNSAVVLRWNLFATQAYSPEQIERIYRQLGNKMTTEGDLLIRSETFRDQDQNRKACIEKLNQLLTSALHVPKKRIRTKPKKSAVRERLDNKKRHAQKKRLRQGDWE